MNRTIKLLWMVQKLSVAVSRILVFSVHWAGTCIRWLKTLPPMCSDTQKIFSAHYGAVALLGRWYSSQGETEQARVKICPFVKRSILDLTDLDESNDYNAYNNLGRALLCFGDRKNAAIAWAFTIPLWSPQNPIEEGPQANAVLDKVSISAVQSGHITDFRLIGRCDGGCDRLEATFKSFSICEICVDTGFCDECLRNLKNGGGIFRVCNPKHPHFEIYPLKGLVMRDVEGYKVHLDEEKVFTADEWLGMISREWLGS
jgi:hypothetical protein